MGGGRAQAALLLSAGGQAAAAAAPAGSAAAGGEGGRGQVVLVCIDCGQRHPAGDGDEGAMAGWLSHGGVALVV